MWNCNCWIFVKGTVFLVNCSVHVPVSIFIPFKTFLPNHFEFDSWCILSSVWIRDALWGVNITDRAACTNIYIYIHYKLSLIHLNQNNNQKMICTKEAIDDWFPIKPNHNTYLFITKHPTSKHNQNWNESFFFVKNTFKLSIILEKKHWINPEMQIIIEMQKNNKNKICDDFAYPIHNTFSWLLSFWAVC